MIRLHTRRSTRNRAPAAIAAALFAAGAALAPGLAAATPGVTNDTIKIGMYGPLTGPVSVYGYPINDGAVAIYKDVNAHGGIHGRKIEVIDEDGSCNPAKTRAAVKKLIHSDDVFMVHGGSCSAAVFAARDEFINNKVPTMLMAATMDKITTPANRYVFTTTMPGSADGAVMLHFIESMPNAKHVAIVRHPNEWAAAKLSKFMSDYKGGGLQIVADVELPSKVTDATSQVLKVKEAKPDVTVLATYPGESAVFLRDALKYGLKGPFVGTTGIMDLLDLEHRAGSKDAVKDVYVTAFLKGPIGSPEMKKWTDIFTKQFPNDKLQSLSFYGMSGALTVVAALEKAGRDLTREKFIDALQSIKAGEAGPAECKVSFSADEHQGCKAGTIWTLNAAGDKILNIGPTWKKVK